MAQVVKDEYAGMLETQGNDLSERKRAWVADHEKWLSAVSHYVDFLRLANKPVPAFAVEALKPKAADAPATEKEVDRYGRPYDGVTRTYRVGAPRVGEKRREILLYIAKATREGRETNSREIVDATGQDYHLVVNTMWMDVKRGLLKYRDDNHTKRGMSKQVSMTAVGFDVLKRAGLLDGPEKE